jgi:hypothetical protein
MKNDNDGIKETDNIKQPVFEISDYSVGDRIDRTEIDILYTDNFGESVIEEASLKENPNVILTLLGKQFIEQIQRIRIQDEELESVINTVDEIFSVDSEYDEFRNVNGNLEEILKAYYWNEKEVSISLKKTIIRNTLNNTTDDNGWTLTYENHLITRILQNFLELPLEPV